MRISVTGTGEERHAPEEAVVSLSAGFDGPSRAAVLRDTAELHERLSTEATARRDDGSIRRWSSDRVRIEPFRYLADGASDPTTWYRGAASFELVFDADGDALGAWLSEVGSRDGVAVTAVDWRLTDETRNDLLDRARTAAVADAIARAAVYARAAGAVSTPRLVAIFEPGLRSADAGPIPGAPAVAMARGGAHGGPTIDLHPRPTVVGASVTADFEVD